MRRTPARTSQPFVQRAAGALSTIAMALGCLGTPGLALAEDWSVFGSDDMPAVAQPEGEYPSSSTEIALVDGDGNMLYTRNADERMPMASTTKIMTAVVAIESGVPLDTACTVPASVGELDPSSSIVGYQPGETVTLGEALEGLLAHSGNDAALTIADCIAGSEEAFVAMMNSKAVELGLVNTHYANPHGLDQEGHYSTAADLVSLARHAMELPLFASIVGSPSVTISVGGTPTTFTSTDALLNVYPGMRGIKTGYTYGAGCAFVGAASRGGQTIYVAVLGNSSNEGRWEDVSTLLDWAFSHYPSTSLVTAGEAVMGYVDFADRFGWVVPTAIDAAAEVRTSPFVIESDLVVNVRADTSSSASTNEEIGQITWYEGNQLISSRTVTTTDELLEKSSFGPFTSDTIYGLDRF